MSNNIFLNNNIEEQLLNKIFFTLINEDKWDTLFEVLSASERKYALFFTKIHQEPGEGGWRWHKWGPYIGKHDIQCEYLADEDLSDIDQKYVVVFHIFEFKDEK